MIIARIVLGLLFGFLSIFMVGYTAIQHASLSDDEMVGFSILAGLSGMAAAGFLAL